MDRLEGSIPDVGVDIRTSEVDSAQSRAQPRLDARIGQHTLSLVWVRSCKGQAEEEDSSSCTPGDDSTPDGLLEDHSYMHMVLVRASDARTGDHGRRVAHNALAAVLMAR